MRHFLFYLILGIVAVTAGMFLPEWEYKTHVLMGLMVIAVVVFIYFFDTKRLSKKEKETAQVIQTLKREGKALAVEQEEQLNAQDLKRLNSRRRLLFCTYLFGVFFIGGFVFFVIHVLVEGSARIYIEILVVSLVVAVLIYLSLKEFNKFNTKLKEGKKTIIRGIVTQKPVEGDEDRDSYFLVIDTVRVHVKESVYDKYKIGDVIEIHIFKPHHNLVLFETKVEGAGLKDLG